MTIYGILISIITCFLLIKMRNDKKKYNIRLSECNNIIRKQEEFYRLFTRWLNIHNHGISVADYCTRNNFRCVAIYGMKEAGELLTTELEKNGIQVLYGIDMDAEKIYAKTSIVKPSEELADVDVIIVTAVHYFEQIEADLRSKVNCQIVSLLDMVYEIKL